MLQSIHDRIKGWVAGTIVAMLSLSFMLWGIQSYISSGSKGGGVVAEVGGEAITHDQLSRASRDLIRAQENETKSPLTDVQTRQVQQMALQTLIMNAVMRQAAVRQGFRISHEQASQFVSTMPGFREAGQFSQSRLQQFLYSSSLTLEQFLAQVRDTLLFQQVSDGLQSSAFVLPEESRQAFSLYYQTRGFGYFLIPSSRFLSRVKVPQKAIARYYERHQQDFMAPEKVSLSYVVLSPKVIAQHIVLNPKAIHQYYEDNLAHFKTAAGKTRSFSAVQGQVKRLLVQQKVDALLAEQSEQLSNLAYTHPDSLEAAADALHLPIKTTSSFAHEGGKAGITASPKVVAAAFSDDVLQQGENSAPIELKDGSLVVLRIKEHKRARLLPLKDVTPKIRLHLASELAEAKAALLASDIQDKLQKGVSVQSLSQQYHLKWQSHSGVGRSDSSVLAPILSSAFQLALSKECANTVVALGNGDAAVIQLRKVTLAHDDGSPSSKMAELSGAMAHFEGRFDYQFYVLSSKAHAKIKMPN